MKRLLILLAGVFLFGVSASKVPVDAANMTPALVESANNPPACLAIFCNNDKREYAESRFYFENLNVGGLNDDTPYPEFLEGFLFFKSSTEQPRKYRCLRTGDVIALAPVNKVRDFTKRMEDVGFTRLSGETFHLFKIGNRHRETDIYAAFSAKLKTGKIFTLPEWVILTGFDVTRQTPVGGELLYNGIRLPEQWPPKVNIDTDDPPPLAPWLENRPDVVPIDIGRQLFVDDFLVEETNLVREFHYPEKYSGNPVLVAETPLERGFRNGKKFTENNAGAMPTSGGLWWNPEKQIFEFWYSAGAFATAAYATSRDGITWERPDLTRKRKKDIAAGNNQIIPDNIRPDSWTVVRDPHTDNPQERFKLFINAPGSSNQFHCYYATSPDGIAWNEFRVGGISGDRSTVFYNPFRRKWICSLRLTRNSSDGGRARAYWEGDDFDETMNWRPDQPVTWARADRLDPNPFLNQDCQLYNLDAVAYESIMLGFFQIHYGPNNTIAKEAGIPKFTGLNFAYSRDGFHWHRPDRNIAVNSSYNAGTWDRGYVQSLGNICTVRGDKLWFYYAGYSGDERVTMGTKYNIDDELQTGAYAGGATGIAILRRDGFVSMNAQNEGTLVTRPVMFTGKYLFVNVNAPAGRLLAQVTGIDGKPVAPFTFENCEGVSDDTTIGQIKWRGGSDLSALADRPVRFEFKLERGKLYAFWVSRDESGRSDGYVAGGGLGFDSKR